ncbi:tumor necrosis factor receptor superfamily member 9a [Parambassis ranga]|uniref:Tumor necrosis factor receptor superfamily member 9a n=1 Tax=Parambassis ranga TaxID=210632 RepID=A0A6P7IWN8_9TELE|nr:tumor necrosis factor receptor superfamily member 9-like [Parambassis ranga]
MAMMLWVLLGLSLLVQGCLCSLGQKGCMKWTPRGDNICCEACFPGNRQVTPCGKRSQDLCTPCETGTWTDDPLSYRCKRCSKCIGVQTHVKNCTATADTQCGCSIGLTCGDKHCSFCVDTCPIGQEPTPARTCRPCPEGTFNDKIHQYCKPWSTKCPQPNQVIVSKGDAVSDIKCADISSSVAPLITTKQREIIFSTVKRTDPDNTGQLFGVIGVAFLFCISIIIIIITIITIAAVKHLQKRKKSKKRIIKPAELHTPTDDPRTLIATECSFHEAQQEQGSSTESLNSKDSSQQLIV